MLSTAVIHEVAELLAAGDLSQRKIAEKCGVSRGTVQLISTGKRGLYGREDSASAVDPIDAPPHRCGGCGALIVTRVCVACKAARVCGRRALSPVEASDYDVLMVGQEHQLPRRAVKPVMPEPYEVPTVSTEDLWAARESLLI